MPEYKRGSAFFSFGGAERSLRWYCVQSGRNEESTALFSLRRKGFQAFLPQHVIVNGRGRRSLLPLFPSYLFVSFDRELDHWKPLIYSHGVKHLFSSTPDSPTPVPVGVVEALISMKFVEPDVNAKPLPVPVGAIAKIIDGPLCGIEGVCSWSSESRVRLLISLLGRDFPADVARDNVEVVR